jgi:hypothetical protein
VDFGSEEEWKNGDGIVPPAAGDAYSYASPFSDWYMASFPYRKNN